jgi:outer membrane receptor for ferrienterochelin and colicin
MHCIYHMFKAILSILVVLHLSLAQVGSIRGRVVEYGNLQPLAGVNIAVQDTRLGAATDTEGNYLIDKVPVGAYTVEFTYMGYETKNITDVIVKSNKTTFVNTELSWQVLEAEAITVQAGYFESPVEASVSSHTLNYEEVRRSPGSREDVSRMIQNFAGVSPTSDDRNDLVVRGGSPSEVLFTVDHIDIPNPNHFGTQGATGGPIIMLNNEFVEEVVFMAGGFPAEYGHKASGAMDIQLREGNRHAYNGKFDFSFAGAGGYLEGPLGSERGSFLVAYHRSYLDLFEDLFNYGGVPIYTNYQGKFAYDLNDTHKTSLLFIGGNDRIDIKYETEIEDFKIGQQPDTVDYQNTDFRSNQYTVGATLRSLWSPKFFTFLTLSHSYNKFFTDVNSIDVAGLNVPGNDEVQNEQAIREVNLYDNSSVEQITSFKLNGTRAFGKNNSFTSGIYLRLNQFDHDIRLQPAHPDRENALGLLPSGFHTQFRQDITPKIGGFVSLEQQLGARFTYNLGMRYDYFALLKEGSLSPRLKGQYRLTDRFSLHAGAGQFYQNPEFIFISSHPSNKNNLKDIRCDHLIAGVNYLITPDTRFTLEGYYKRYDTYPVSADSGYEMISMANSGAEYGTNLQAERLVSKGQGKAKGIELTLHKKLVEKLYGLVTYSYSIIQHKALDGIYRNGAFDNRHVFNCILSYRLSKSWEFSTKWRYAGGVPYTPYDIQASIAAGNGMLDLQRINVDRYSPYRRIDIRVDYRSFYRKYTVITYVSIENLFDHKNVYYRYWNRAQEKTDYAYQISRFIVGGVSFEF